MRPEDIVRHIDQLLSPRDQSTHEVVRIASELVQGTISVLASVYGEQSARVESFRTSLERARQEINMTFSESRVVHICQGALLNLRNELTGGLAGSLQMTLTADVLSDFLQLARLSLEQGSEGSKNVASVLVAAAFEDTIRRMGETLAGVTGHPDLEVVIGALKSAGILKAPLLGQVNSHLKFRNDALHARWADIDKVSVETAWQLVQGLLMKHFQ